MQKIDQNKKTLHCCTNIKMEKLVLKIVCGMISMT